MIVAGKLSRPRGLALGVPDALRDHRPLLGGEAAHQPGGAALGGKRGLDGEGAAAAEGITEVAFAAVARDVYAGGGERLAQRRRDVRRTVAALVQPRAGRIEIEHRLVVHDGKLDLVLRALLREPLHTVAPLEPLDDGLFHDLLAVRDRMELRLQAVALHRERAVRGDEGLPRQRLDALEEHVKRVRAKAPELDEHALAEPAAQIHARHSRRVAAKAHAPVFRHDSLDVHTPKLISHKPLQPEQTRDAELQFLHIVPPSAVSPIISFFPGIRTDGCAAARPARTRAAQTPRA